jgi:hypothetical protein
MVFLCHLDCQAELSQQMPENPRTPNSHKRGPKKLYLIVQPIPPCGTFLRSCKALLPPQPAACACRAEGAGERGKNKGAGDRGQRKPGRLPGTRRPGGRSICGWLWSNPRMQPGVGDGGAGGWRQDLGVPPKGRTPRSAAEAAAKIAPKVDTLEQAFGLHGREKWDCRPQ